MPRLRGGGCCPSKSGSLLDGAATVDMSMVAVGRVHIGDGGGEGGREDSSARDSAIGGDEASPGTSSVETAFDGGRIRRTSHGSRKYFDADALIASVESGAIALLRGRWIVKLFQRGGRLERRQDLPPEAFMSAGELRRLVAALGDDWGLLLVAISYRYGTRHWNRSPPWPYHSALRVFSWLTADHPDPEAFHLSIVASVAALYLKPSPGRSFFSSPLVDAFERAGLGQAVADFGVLWDFGSLHQKPRSDTQTELFKQGLAALPMWYGHAATVMWMQPDLPEGFGERMAAIGLAETYEASGWCFVESSVSAGIKRNDRRLNLGLRTERALKHAYGGAWKEEGRLDRVCAAQRPAPMAPEEVAEVLRDGGKKFTNSADLEVVAKLYRSYFESVASTATQLTFAYLKWGNAEVMALAAVLPRYVSVTNLDLSGNAFGGTGAVAIAQAVGAMRSLATVWSPANEPESLSPPPLSL